MISLTSFRENCLPLFRVMAGTHMKLEIVYKGEVYDMIVNKTDKKPDLIRVKRKAQPVIRQVDVEPCDECGSLRFSGVCMNGRCIHASGLMSVQAPILPQQPTGK